VIQFLQLLNGGDLPEVRTGNTLEALVRLERVRLPDKPRTIDPGGRTTPFAENRASVCRSCSICKRTSCRRTATSCASSPGGWADVTTGEQSALETFLGDYRDKTELNRKILDHLLHDAFSDDQQTQAEVDLVLDPDPPEQRIVEVLGRYAFHDVKQAYRNLMSLAEERIPFLSTRRCRHFLAAIAPQLLAAIAATADPIPRW